MQTIFVPGYVPVVDVGIQSGVTTASRYTYSLSAAKVLMRFEIWKYLARAAHVDLAELVLPAPVYSQKGGFVSLAPMLQPWSATEVSWTERLTGVSWGTPGCLAGVDYGPTISVSQDSSSPEFRMDVTDIVRQWRDRASPNYGWLLTGNVWVNGARNPSPSHRPSLLMRYSTKRSRSRSAWAGISHGEL